MAKEAGHFKGICIKVLWENKFATWDLRKQEDRLNFSLNLKSNDDDGKLIRKPNILRGFYNERNYRA